MPNLQMLSARLFANIDFLWSRRPSCCRSLVSLEQRMSRRSLSVNRRQSRLQNCEKKQLICQPTFTKPQTRPNQDASFSLNKAFTTIRFRPTRKRANRHDASFLPATKESSLANRKVRQPDRVADSVAKAPQILKAIQEAGHDRHDSLEPFAKPETARMDWRNRSRLRTF
jgi:hypothetical protein